MLQADDECPKAAKHFYTTLNLIANKWSVRLIYSLLRAPDRTLRFGALRAAMDGISQGELTKHLREFEQVGLITRRVYSEIPPRVEYTLTELGTTLCEPIEALASWAKKHGVSLHDRATPARQRTTTAV